MSEQNPNIERMRRAIIEMLDSEPVTAEPLFERTTTLSPAATSDLAEADHFRPTLPTPRPSSAPSKKVQELQALLDNLQQQHRAEILARYYQLASQPSWQHLQSQRWVAKMERQVNQFPELMPYAVNLLRQNRVNVNNMQPQQMQQIVRELQKMIAQFLAPDPNNPEQMQQRYNNNPELLSNAIALNPVLFPLFVQQLDEAEAVIEDAQNVQVQNDIAEAEQHDNQVTDTNTFSPSPSPQPVHHDQLEEAVSTAIKAVKKNMEHHGLAQTAEKADLGHMARSAASRILTPTKIPTLTPIK